MAVSDGLPLERQRRRFTLNIRGKIILPYLILTLIVAVIGTYVVTSLVAGSLDERLTNHLLEAGRVVSDSMARHEASHLESARLIAFTRGLAEALQAGDAESVAALAQPAAVGLGVECLMIVHADGRQMLHLMREEDGTYRVLEEQFSTSELGMVQSLLAAGDVNGLPQRGLGLYPATGRYYYFTSIPVPLQGELVGVVSVGTSLETLLALFKATSLADVILHLDDGKAVATTFAFPDQPADTAALLDQLSISPQLYDEVLYSVGSTIGENIRIRGRWYRLARSPLRVGDQTLGVFTVALPSHFIVRAGTTSRNTYALLFSAVMVSVIVIGYLVSQRITRPLGRLVSTSQAVAEGDLQRRTGIGTADEIGVLAATFDEMTQRLEERTSRLKELLQAHKEAAGGMRAILSSIGDGVLLEDLEGNFHPLNAAARSLLDEMATHFLLGPLREVPPQKERPGLDQPNPWLLEHRRFQVGEKALSVHSAAVRTDEGEHLGTVIVLRDITAEVEAEHLKDAFVAHVSHELRTPLTAIKGYSALLLAGAGGTLQEEQCAFLRTISRHTDNLMAMINTLLDFSEMEAGGRLGLQRRPLLLSALVEEIAQEWRPQMDESGLTFQVEVCGDLPPVNADPRRLRWALNNLVRNAWQYTPSGGRVTLRLAVRDGRVVLDVEDTGIGIPPEDQQRLFSRFYRVARAEDDVVRGLGLGLYVTRAIIEAHGGEIRVSSRVGMGSTFTVLLPALESSQTTAGAEQEAR